MGIAYTLNKWQWLVWPPNRIAFGLTTSHTCTLSIMDEFVLTLPTLSIPIFLLVASVNSLVVCFVLSPPEQEPDLDLLLLDP